MCEMTHQHLPPGFGPLPSKLCIELWAEAAEHCYEFAMEEFRREYGPDRGLIAYRHWARRNADIHAQDLTSLLENLSRSERRGAMGAAAD